MAKAALLAGGVALLVAGGAALGWGLTRPTAGTDLQALQKVAVLIDSEIKQRRAQVTTRAEGTAIQNPLRNAIGSDPATIADLIKHGDLALPPPDTGETLELGQVFGDKVETLLLRPENGQRPPFVSRLKAEELRDAGVEVLMLGEPAVLSRVVRIVPSDAQKNQEGYLGYLVVSRTLDLSAAVAELAALRLPAQLAHQQTSQALGAAPPASATLTKLPISSSPGLELSVAAVAARPRPIAAMAAGGAAALSGVVLLALALLGAGRRQGEARAGEGRALAAGTPAVQTPVPGAITMISGPGASASLSSMQGGAVLGRWELLRRLGSGGMADVHLAHSRGEAGFEKLVALKVMHPFLARSGRAVEHFLDEARVAAQIVHSNVVQIYDLGKIGEDYVIVMEYVDGANLDTLLSATRASGRPVPVPVALGILRRICDGLTAAHRALAKDGTPLQIVHRDVKSGNVLVSRQGVVKVVDFGIAKAAQQSHVTMAGETKGTPSMMAPEQRVGDVVDVRADVYSTAAVGYELLTNTAVNLDLAALAHLGTEGWPHLAAPSKVRAELPAELDQILLGAMAFDRDQRPADCAMLEAQFEAVAKRHHLECSDKELARWVQGELALLGEGTPLARPAADSLHA
ncbi:MAG: serine/threonine protein kinase [Myxococcales bacterium]|nr:serine/threonine protein kinase [Myxococcales bacterium]